MTAGSFKRRYPAMHARTRFGEVLGAYWASLPKRKKNAEKGPLRLFNEVDKCRAF